MAGTDRRKADALANAQGGPAVILVEPQLGENIGMAARAMLNCGLSDLRLVSPRPGWSRDKAEAASAGADVLFASMGQFSCVENAVANLNRVYAATARPRDMTKPVVTPRQAVREMAAAEAAGERCGVLFGRESVGLHNDHVALADVVLTAPLNPAFSSLNLAQSVLLIGYEWRCLGDDTAPRQDPLRAGTRAAAKHELVGLFEHLERELDASGFLFPPEKRPAMVRNLRNMLQRASLTEQEVRTLRGVIASLGKRHGN